MKIESDPEEVLANFEVLDLLRGSRKEHLARLRVRQHRLAGMAASEVPSNLRIVQTQTLAYLEGSAARDQDSSHLERLLQELSQFDLAPAEVQMLINLRPGTPAQLMPVLDECLDRFSQQQLTELLEAVGNALPAAPPLDSGAGDDAGFEGEEYDQEGAYEAEVEEGNEELLEEFLGEPEEDTALVDANERKKATPPPDDGDD